MPFDATVLAAVTSELKQSLPGARIDRVYQPEKLTMILHLRQGRENMSLVICAHAQDARIHLTEHEIPNPPVPPSFCMLMRKHLEGGRIVAVYQPPLERILAVTVTTRDEFGMTASCKLYCEFMGKHSNIILTRLPADWETAAVPLVLGAAKLVGEDQSRYRVIAPGKEYTPPPPQDKYNLLTQELDRLPSYLEVNAGLPPAKALVNSMLGISPVMAQEIVYRSGLQEEGGGLLDQLALLKARLQQEQFHPHLHSARNGEMKDYYAWKMEHIDASLQSPRSGMNALLDEFFCHRRQQEMLEQMRRNLTACANKALQAARRRYRKQDRELEKAGAAGEYRHWGELLTANFYRLPERAGERVEVPDFSLPGSPPVEVPLDPRLTVKENARRYFNKYQRATRALKQLHQRLRETGEEISYLQGVIYSLESADSMEVLEEVSQELIAGGYYTPSLRKGEKKIKTPEARLEPRKYVSADGYEILVGRNNRQNDRLTLRMANPNDTWLHTKDIPGSHVIIRGENPPPTTLEEAARLAATFSRAARSGNVPVDYTLIKHVRKPKGARPGMVIYDHQKTLYVTPEN